MTENNGLEFNEPEVVIPTYRINSDLIKVLDDLTNYLIGLNGTLKSVKAATDELLDEKHKRDEEREKYLKQRAEMEREMKLRGGIMMPDGSVAMPMVPPNMQNRTSKNSGGLIV